MRIQLQWKDPDFVGTEGLTKAQRELLEEVLSELGIGEYVVLTIDLEARTAEFCPPRKS